MELLYARGRASSTKQPGLLKHRDKRLLLAIIVSGIAGAGLGEIFWPRVDAKPSFEAVEPVQESSRRLPNEAAFEQTLRSCLGAACYTATPKGSRADSRIALLAPPSQAADAFFAWYVALAKRGGVTARKVEWVQTSHAPPYGYGKNHGYTRIVRLALPLLASVAASSHADEAEIEQARAKLLGFLEKTCGAPREVMARASRDVRISATRRADVGELKGHLDYYYHLAGHSKQLRSRRAVASALGLSGDW